MVLLTVVGQIAAVECASDVLLKNSLDLIAVLDSFIAVRDSINLDNVNALDLCHPVTSGRSALPIATLRRSMA